MIMNTKTIRTWATGGHPDLEKDFDQWLSELIRKERAEGWDEGSSAVDTVYEHIFNGHPVPEGEMCDECDTLGRNPYQKEQS